LKDWGIEIDKEPMAIASSILPVPKVSLGGSIKDFD
jgi:hypothetical protein